MKNVKIGLVAVGLLATTFVGAQEDRGRHNGQNKFERLDADADGKITKEEFTAAKEAIEKRRQDQGKEHKPMDIDKKFEKLDANADGAIDKAEFDQAQAERAKNAAERKEKHFANIDTDGNGTVSKAEFDVHHAAMEAKRKEKNPDCKPGDADKRFKKLDTNADGAIDKTEFENAHQHKHGKKPQGKQVK